MFKFWNKFIVQRISTCPYPVSHVNILYYHSVYMLGLFSHVQLFATPWTIAHQAPLSVGILQARILKWVAMPSSGGSSPPRDQNHDPYVSCISRQVLYY